MATKTYIRPSGNPITVNDNKHTQALAAEKGWTEEKPKPKRKARAKKSDE